MGKILLFILLPISSFFGQSKDIIYRIASESNDAVGYSYNINVLTLMEKNEYNLIQQKYVSKKFAKKNIPSRFSKTFGILNIKNDTLKLIDNETKREMLFVIKKDYLIYLFNNIEPTNYHWKKVEN